MAIDIAIDSVGLSPMVEPHVSPSMVDGRVDDVPSTIQESTQISITGFLSTPLRSFVSSWLLLSQDEETREIHVSPQPVAWQEIWMEGGQEIARFLLEDLGLEEGMILRSINDVTCQQCSLEQVQEMLVTHTGMVTFTFGPSSSTTTTATVLKQVVALNPSCISPKTTEASTNVLAMPDEIPPDFAIQIPLVKVEKATPRLDKIPADTCPPPENDETIESTTPQSTTPQNSMLSLASDPSNDCVWFEKSCMAEGDQILSINGRDRMAEFEPEDANLWLHSLCQYAPYVSVELAACTLRRDTWRSKLRKSAVAVGGGAMVGAGAVLMVTPLHPVGHALAFGGIGVLGTEFEKPKAVARRAGQGLRSMFQRSRRDPDSSEVNNESPLDATETTPESEARVIDSTESGDRLGVRSWFQRRPDSSNSESPVEGSDTENTATTEQSDGKIPNTTSQGLRSWFSRRRDASPARPTSVNDEPGEASQSLTTEENVLQSVTTDQSA